MCIANGRPESPMTASREVVEITQSGPAAEIESGSARRLWSLPPRFAAATVVALTAAAISLLASPSPEAGHLLAAPPSARSIVEAARDEVRRGVRYDASYVTLAYPGGDVPRDRGACTDVLVRA